MKYFEGEKFIILTALATFSIACLCMVLIFIPIYYEVRVIEAKKKAQPMQEVIFINHDVTSIMKEEIQDGIHPIVTFKKPTATSTTYTKSSTGKLTKSSGVFNGPSGKETYYNLDMSGVVKIMRNAGFAEDEYPYWVREDGCKMLGSYIMIAANLELRPRGSLVETSLGTGIVCDTGSFANHNETQIDVAVSW